MPIYQYKCDKCEKVFDVWAKISDAPPERCEYCQTEGPQKVIGGTNFALKGSGWYTTDYKKPQKKESKQ